MVLLVDETKDDRSAPVDELASSYGTGVTVTVDM
jgi:hypothetical protein